MENKTIFKCVNNCFNSFCSFKKIKFPLIYIFSECAILDVLAVADIKRRSQNEASVHTHHSVEWGTCWRQDSAIVCRVKLWSRRSGAVTNDPACSSCPQCNAQVWKSGAHSDVLPTKPLADDCQENAFLHHVHHPSFGFHYHCSKNRSWYYNETNKEIYFLAAET